MRKVMLYMITTLDGFIAGNDGDVFEYTPSEDEMKFSNEFFTAANEILFGRVIYELFISYWDTLDLNDASISWADKDFAKHFRTMTRIVFSRRLDHVAENAILIKDDIAVQVTKLKQQSGRDLILVCGPELLSTFLALGLVDECCLMVRPLAIGSGKALFGDIKQKAEMKLLSTQVFDSGVVLHRYQPT